MRESGRKPSGNWPTAFLAMWRSWSMTSSVLSTAFAPRRENFAVASCNPSYLLFCAKVLHYLYRDQIVVPNARFFVAGSAHRQVRRQGRPEAVAGMDHTGEVSGTARPQSEASHGFRPS